MKSRTSFCNLTVLRKDVTRFYPAWVLASLVQILLLQLIYSSGGSTYAQIESLLNGMTILSVIMDAVYGFVLGQLLFGDLFNSRLCYGLHAMPVRRTELYNSHILAGLFMLAVSDLSFLLAAQNTGAGRYLVPMVLLRFGIGVFFFLLAAFCAMCTGSRVGMTLLYGVLNFGALALYRVADLSLSGVFYGIVIPMGPFELFMPVVQLCVDGLFQISDAGKLSLTTVYPLVLCGLVPVLYGVSWYLYRRRQLESCGDFLTVKQLGLLFTLVWMAVMATVFSVVSSYMMVVGALVGYFTAQMLLRRTVKVFQVPRIAQCAAILAAWAVVYIGCTLLSGNWVNYVPEVQEVKSASVNVMGERQTFSDPEGIELVRTIHQKALEERKPGDDGCYWHISYETVDGKTVTREYFMEMDDNDPLLLRLARESCVTPDDPEFESYLNTRVRVFANGIEVELEKIEGLDQAIRADVEKGAIPGIFPKWNILMAARSDYGYTVEILRKDDGVTIVYVNDDCTNLLDWMGKAGVIDIER